MTELTPARPRNQLSARLNDPVRHSSNFVAHVVVGFMARRRENAKDARAAYTIIASPAHHLTRKV